MGPRTGSGRLGPPPVHRRAHGLDGFLQTDEDGLANEEVADVELHDLRDHRHRAGCVVVEAVAGMDLEANAGAVRGRIAQARQLVSDSLAVALRDRLAIRAGVE